MASTQNNEINSLIQNLTYNTEIEDSITKNGGKIVYAYNNIIMATEISDVFYKELSKNPYVDSIYDVPLKRYGSIDKNLINQVNNTQVPQNESGNAGTQGTSSNNEPIVPSVVGISPSITSILSLSANTNEWLNYTITATGTGPIRFEMIADVNESTTDTKYYNWTLTGDEIKGISELDGYFNITLKAINSYGFDIKTLVVEIRELPKIVSNLVATCKKSNLFAYKILSSGPSPKTYSVTGLTGSLSGLSLNGDVISGTPSIPGDYNIILGVSNLYGTDSKTLKLTIGSPPVITSNGYITKEEEENLTYHITSSGGYPTNITYNVTDTLPEGLSASGNLISGKAKIAGITTVMLHATNTFGESTKKLIIEIKVMNLGGGI